MALIDREFPTYGRGEIRELILVHWRAALAELSVDPITIRRATLEKSRDWVEADSIDLFGQAVQKRGDFFAQQVNPERAAAPFLYSFHAKLSGLEPLAAQGGAGVVTALGATGTEYIGSTTLPDEFATVAIDDAGNQYQVFVGGTVGAGGSIALPLQAVSTGRSTNIPVGTVLTWINKPIGSEPTCTVTGDDFRGGVPKETAQEFIRRLMDVRRSRPKAGNPSHVRFWGRAISNSVEDVFVYPCALHSGSMIVAVVQKRAGAVGPNGRQPTFATLGLVTGQLVPPTSPELPGDPHVVVTGWTPEPCTMVLKLGMPLATEAGWSDQIPWPSSSGTPSTIQSVATQSSFVISASTAPPSGITPKLMLWNDLTSAFEELAVLSVAPSGTNYQVTLSAPHAGKTLLAGDFVMPDTARRTDIAEAIVAYFDSLGPGELVSLASDVRAARAFRRIEPEIRYSYFAGGRVLEYARDGLGVSLVHEQLLSVTPSEPSLPVSASLGPNMLVPGRIGVYAL